jgi:ribosome-associated protein
VTSTSRGRRRTQPVSAEAKAEIAAAAILSRKGRDPVLLDLRGITLIADFFLLCHGTSTVHIKALTDAVVERLKKRGIKPSGREGQGQSGWTLLDYGDVIVHIFSEEQREFYSLERLWGDAPSRPVAAKRRRSGREKR